MEISESSNLPQGSNCKYLGLFPILSQHSFPLDAWALASASAWCPRMCPPSALCTPCPVAATSAAALLHLAQFSEGVRFRSRQIPPSSHEATTISVVAAALMLVALAPATASASTRCRRMCPPSAWPTANSSPPLYSPTHTTHHVLDIPISPGDRLHHRGP